MNLHDARDYEMAAFGPQWCGPDRYAHWEKTLVARYPKDTEEGDGQPCEVYCTAAPARFYTIKVLQADDSMGKSQSPWALAFGSGSHDLVATMAKAIAQGMVGLEQS